MRGALPSTVAKKRAGQPTRKGIFAAALNVPEGDGRKSRENMMDDGSFSILR